MNSIEIQFIPHEQQRYQTTGDWFESSPGAWVIRVSKMDEPRHMWLVAIHELVEMLLCIMYGVSQAAVDNFDFAWVGEGEPGDYPGSPYYYEHQTACVVERVAAFALGVNWKDYEEADDALYK